MVVQNTKFLWKKQILTSWKRKGVLFLKSPLLSLIIFFCNYWNPGRLKKNHTISIDDIVTPSSANYATTLTRKFNTNSILETKKFSDKVASNTTIPLIASWNANDKLNVSTMRLNLKLPDSNLVLGVMVRYRQNKGICFWEKLFLLIIHAFQRVSPKI